jgi:hypothetical protein
MARQRLPGTVLPPPSTLEKHPDHVHAIGMISIEIGNLEINLAELLAALLHIDRHFGRVVYLTPQSFSGRLNILKNVMKDHLVEGSEGRKYVESVVSKANGYIGKRHEYVHNLWGISPDNPQHIVRQDIGQRKRAKLVPLEELTTLINNIRELSEDVRKSVEMSFATWPPYTWRESPPAPPLVIPERETNPPASATPKRKRRR